MSDLLYNKTNWKDDESTPINARNLNNIENGIEYIYKKWDKIIQDSTTGDHAAELIDARYGPYDSEQHPTLGHRLNHMDNKFIDVNSQLEQNTHYVNLRKYKHLVKSDDWTLALQTAVNENNKVIISETINIYGTVVLSSDKVIEIGACSVIKPSTSNDDAPIFWLKGSSNTLRGQGQSSSIIQSKISTPEGVVKIGHTSDTVAESNSTYNQISDLTIWGAERNDDVTIGLQLLNSELNGFASYFSTINNIRVSNAFMGIVFKGYANANLLSNIQLYACGGNQKGGGICFLAIDSKVPMENAINGVFHHFSQNASTILIDCDTFYNKITNILSEQGGANAYCIYVTDNGKGAFHNTFIYTDNVSYGNSYPSLFEINNILIGRDNICVGNLKSEKFSVEIISAKKISFTNKKSNTYKSNIPISENQKVKLITISKNGGQNMKGILLTIKLYTDSTTNVSDFIQTGEQKCQIKQTANTTPSITVLSEIGYKMIWEDNVLYVIFPDNGTNTSNGVIYFDIEIFGYTSWPGIAISDDFIEI